jgi:hypothetical protein
MKYLLLITLFALTFASCTSKDHQYNWVCTSDSSYFNAQGLQHKISSTTVRFKTKAEIKTVEEKMCQKRTDSTGATGVDVSCKK